MSTVERRFLAAQVRSVANSQQPNSPGTIIGYAAVYDSLSEDLGGFRERLNPGCFDKCLASNPNVFALVNHDPNLVLGRTRSGTLQLFGDRMGLRMECVLPNTSTGRDLYESIQRGDLSQMSFAFRALDDSWDDEDDPEDDDDIDPALRGRGRKKITVRTIRQADVQDVSVVAMPAYEATSVSIAKIPIHNSLRSLARDAAQLFPMGVPVEVRQHVRNVPTRNTNREFIHRILGL